LKSGNFYSDDRIGKEQGMSIQEIMAGIVSEEGQRLGVSSPEFIQRHNEIMSEAERLIQDLMMEQRETA
jgi:hypothetical protein